MKTSIQTVLVLMFLVLAGQAMAQVVTIGEYNTAVPGGDAVIDVMYDNEGQGPDTVSIVINFSDIYSNVAIVPSDGNAVCDATVLNNPLSDCLWGDAPGVGAGSVFLVTASGIGGPGNGRIARITYTLNGDVPLNTLDPLVGEINDFEGGSIVNGQIFVPEGPQPDWSSAPTSAAGLDFGSKTTETGAYPLDLVVTNTGEAGSILTGSCAVTGTVFSIDGDNTLGAGLAMGASSSITVQCDTTGAAVQLHTGTMSCTHDGDGTTETSPTDYALSCNVTATPQPSFLGVDSGLSAMSVAEQGDPDATATLTVSNNGETGTTLIGTCAYAGDTEIAVTNGSFALAQGASTDVLATCSGAAEGTYTGTLTCGPTDPQTWIAADSPYAVSCTVGPPGDAVYASAPAAGSVIDMTTAGEPVPVGTAVADQDLVITNDPPEANDRDLALLNCGLTDGTGAISATAATTPLAPYASTTVTFSCDTATVGDHTDTYSCGYDVDGDGAADGTATYTVNCAVRAAASEVTETPVSGTALTMYVPFGGVGQASIAFDEVLDEGEDATLTSCTLDDETYFSIVAPASFPQTITSGGSVEVLVEGMGTNDGQPTNATLTCNYTDSQNESAQASWPLDVVVLAAGIPTLSTWGLMLMILTLLGLGGLVIRRKDLS